MQLLEVSGAVRPIYGSLGVRRLIIRDKQERIKEDAVWSASHYSRNIHLEQLTPMRKARTRSRPLACYTERYLFR